MSDQDRKTLLQNLWDRRFFQFTFSYLLGGFAIVQFVEWLSSRYAFSKSWTDMTFLFLVAIIPSVLLFIYHHGEDGPQSFSKLEKRFIPTNVAGALLLIVFLFTGSDLPADSQTEKVTVINEEGQKLERIIPLSVETKRLVLFPLEDLENLDNPGWLPIGFSVLQNADLEQDNRLFAFSSFDVQFEYNQKNLKLGSKIPLSTYRRIAQDYLSDFFMKGDYVKKGDNYQIKIEVYSTQDGKEFFSKTYEDSDIFDLVDQISIDSREAFFKSDVNSKNRPQVIDLPAADQFTANIEALRYYLEGKIAESENKIDKGIELLKKAVAIDPNFAEAHMLLGINQYNTQLHEEGKNSLAKAVSISNDLGLPERQQFNIKYFYYAFTDDNEKQVNLLKMWNQLYPKDYYPYFRLYNIHNDQRNYPLAEEYALKALNQGHRARSLPRLASICSRQGKYEDALNYLQLFEKEYPHKAKVNPDMGRLYQRMGQFEKALDYFKAIQLLKPDDPYNTGNLAFVSSDMGQMDKAETLYFEALSQARTTDDSTNVLHWISFFYGNLGKISTMERYFLQNLKLREKKQTPKKARIMLTWYDFMKIFYDNGDQEKYKVWLDDYVNTFYADIPQAACVTYLSFYIAIKNKEEAKKRFKECGDKFAEYAGSNFIYLFKGMLAEMEEDYPEMIAQVQQFLEGTNSSEYYFESFLARAYRLNNQLDKSHQILSKLLITNPYNPEIRTEMAQTYLAMDKEKEAIEHLLIACDIWEEADPTYRPANEAKAQLASLQQ